MERKPLNELERQELARIHEASRAGTHYDVLGVDVGATKDDVEGAYHAFVRQWHPDRFFNRETGDLHATIDENFAAVTRAFRVLRDEAHRKAYDLEVRAQNRTARPAVQPPPPPPVREGGKETPGFEVTFRRLEKELEAEPKGPAAPRQSKAPSAVEKIRQQLHAQLVQAQRYYQAGKADFEAGRWTSAESSLYLATRYDPQNPEYKSLHADASTRARNQRAAHLVALAEQAEGYGQSKEAITHYRKAVALDPPEGRAFFRLAQILRTQEDDMRGAVELYRKAVIKEPRNFEYCMTLAEVYDGLGLTENARRLATIATALDRNHAGAKLLLKKLR